MQTGWLWEVFLRCLSVLLVVLAVCRTGAALAQVEGDQAVTFGYEGRWEIARLPGRCIAGTQTADKSATLLFELKPKMVLALASKDWNIPAGSYSITVSHTDDDGKEKTEALTGLVNDAQRKAIVVRFTSPDEVAKLVERPWLNFSLNHHELFFNTSATEAIRVLALCSKKAEDPFATVK